jgi:hypothetical protein
MSLSELLEKGAKDGELSCERCRVRTPEIVPMRCILGRCYSRTIEGRKAYPFAGHSCR